MLRSLVPRTSCQTYEELAMPEIADGEAEQELR